MTLTEAKDHLDELLAKVADGEEVVIVHDDGSTFGLVPMKPTPPKRRGLVGSMRGNIWMADDFDEIPEGFEPYIGDEPTDNDPAQGDDLPSPTPLKDRSEFFGILKGRVRMAPDFDDIPDGFEPYLDNESHHSGEDTDASDNAGSPADLTAPIQRRPRRESYGILKGKIWMAPDFDDIPDGFEPYLGDNYVADK